jgi:hypothetical protein
MEWPQTTTFVALLGLVGKEEKSRFNSQQAGILAVGDVDI